MGLFGSLLRRYTEWSARKYTLAEFADQLEESGQKVHGRFQSAANSERPRQAARHIIGIERWSQRRLRVALGEPLRLDEYDAYRPDANLDIVALAQTFAETRQETLTLARQLAAANPPPSQTIPHNELGDLTIKGWLAYIKNHATRESLLLR